MAKLKKSINVLLLIGLFVSSVFLSAFLLRQNNLGMIELRNEVIKIDEETGSLEQIEPALNELRSYVLTHMNAEMPQRLELPGAYAQAVEQARKEAEKSGQVNAAVYRKAQEVCEDPNKPLSTRAQCIQSYVSENARPGTNPEELQFPDKSLYSYDFASPLWSSDFAGWSILVSFGLGSILLYRFFVGVILAKMRRMIDEDPLE